MILHNINTSQKIFEFDLSDQVDLPALKNSICDYKKTYPKAEITGFYSWHSGYYAHKKSNELLNLVNHIEQIANKYYLEDHLKFTVNFEAKECLFHDYPVYGSSTWHTHHPLCITTVFYVSAENTSELVFENHTIKPKTGMLLMFSGSVTHKVNPRLAHHSERIVVSANLYPIFDFSYCNEQSIKNEKNYVAQY